MIINMHEAKSTLSKLVAAVEAGGEVIIARNGKPAVVLVKFTLQKKPALTKSEK